MDRCPSCSSAGVRVKDHGTWIGYFCPACGAGGSRQKAQRPEARPGSTRRPARKTGGKACPGCGSPRYYEKDHGTWTGYFCPACGAGGSRSKKKRSY